MTPAPLLVALSATLALTASATNTAAQRTVLDEGAFRHTLRGSPVGTETFTIRRSGAGANATTVAQGRILLDTGREIRAVLQLRGNTFRPTAYQIEVAGDNPQNISGRAAGNRFRATIVSTTGEEMREFLAPQNAVVIDPGAVHQYYFLAAALDDGGAVTVIFPRQSRHVTARVADHGTETIQIDGQQLSARRLSVQMPGMPDRVLWVDGRNRVLRFRIPDEEKAAERTAIP